MIDAVIAKLTAFNDGDLRARPGNDHKAILKLVNTFFHCE